MASISKTKSGTWKAVVRKSGWPTAAKTFRTKRDATDWVRHVEDEMVRGVYVNRATSSRLTLNAALDRYVQEATPTKKASTQIREVRRIEILRKSLGKYSLMALTPEVVSKHRDKRLRAGKSANTVRLELALLSNLFNIAIREWRLGIPSNPVSMVRKPTPSPGRDRRLRGDEEERLIAACDSMRNPMIGWIVRLAIFTGMRRGELLGIRCHQVDLDRRTITLSETKNGTSRTIPLIKKAVPILELALGNPLRPADTDLVFFGEPGRDGKRRPFAVESAWYIALHKADIKGLRFHDLRHEAVSRFVEAGLSDQEVAAISGHKSMQMLRRYTHLRSEDLVSRLDKIFS